MVVGVAVSVVVTRVGLQVGAVVVIGVVIGVGAGAGVGVAVFTIVSLDPDRRLTPGTTEPCNQLVHVQAEIRYSSTVYSSFLDLHILSVLTYVMPGMTVAMIDPGKWSANKVYWSKVLDNLPSVMPERLCSNDKRAHFTIGQGVKSS